MQGNWKFVLGLQELKTQQSQCHMELRPPGERLTAAKPSHGSLQRIAALFAFVLPGKSHSRKVCACICECRAMVHLPGQKKQKWQQVRNSQGVERELFSLCEVCAPAR